MTDTVKGLAEAANEERNDTETSYPNPEYDGDVIENRAEKEKYPGGNPEKTERSWSLLM